MSACRARGFTCVAITFHDNAGTDDERPDDRLLVRLDGLRDSHILLASGSILGRNAQGTAIPLLFAPGTVEIAIGLGIAGVVLDDGLLVHGGRLRSMQSTWQVAWYGVAKWAWCCLLSLVELTADVLWLSTYFDNMALVHSSAQHVIAHLPYSFRRRMIQLGLAEGTVEPQQI